MNRSSLVAADSRGLTDGEEYTADESGQLAAYIYIICDGQQVHRALCTHLWITPNLDIGTSDQ